MNDEPKKSQKYPQVIKHYSNPVPAARESDYTYNHQPVVIDHESYYRALIRDKVRPFAPEPVAPVMTPFALSIVDKPEVSAMADNPHKVIDFNLITLTEAEKRQHAETLYNTIRQLAYCWNRAIDINLNADGLYYLFESYRWQCPSTGVTQSWKTPLSIEFKVHPFAGGRIALFNIQPRFVRGWLPGEYRWAGKPSLAELVASA